MANWPSGYLARTIVPQRDKPDPLIGDIPWLRIEDFDGKYLSQSKSGQGVTWAQVSEMPLRVFPEGTVVCSCSCSMGATAITTRAVVTNQTFIGIVPGDEVIPDFLYWLLHAMREELQSQATGAIQQYLSREDFNSLRIPLPPVDEQRRIASFLDDQVGQIDAAIRLRDRQAALLETRASAYAESLLRPAGSLEVPARHLVQEVAVGIVIQPAALYTHSNEGVPAVRGTDISPGDIAREGLVRISIEGHAANQRSRLRQGDVLVVRSGRAGAASRVPEWLTGGNCIDVVIVRPGPSVDPAYLEHSINSHRAQEAISEHSTGAIQRHFGVEAMRALPIVQRPMSEQTAIALELDQSRKEHEQAETLVRANQQTLAERRHALITAAVTGRFDVTAARAVA